MRTPEEIKKAFECCMQMNGCRICPYSGKRCTVELSTDTLAYIGKLEAQVLKWISVEERLPEDDVDVLVYAIGNNENSCVAMTSYTHNMHGYNIEGWRSPWQYFFYERKITHWMPLPEAPKEG